MAIAAGRVGVGAGKKVGGSIGVEGLEGGQWLARVCLNCHQLDERRVAGDLQRARNGPWEGRAIDVGAGSFSGEQELLRTKTGRVHGSRRGEGVGGIKIRGINGI